MTRRDGDRAWPACLERAMSQGILHVVVTR